MKQHYTKQSLNRLLYVTFFWEGFRDRCFHSEWFPEDVEDSHLIEYARTIAGPEMIKALQETESGLSLPEQFEVELLVDPTGQLS